MDSSQVVRRDRGLRIAQAKRIKTIGSVWVVPSESHSGSYVVTGNESPSCTCPDYELRREPCKHVFAVEFVRHRIAPDGTPVTETLKITYSQDWPRYNAAQCAEKDTVQVLLRDLCDGIITPAHPGRGPKPIPLCDAVYGMTMKVYTGMSGRRASSDIRACAQAEHMTRQPHYNSLFNYFEKPEMTPLLTALVQDSAAPLASVESQFAADATGFSTSVYRRWYDHKYGREMKEAQWIKAHIMTGVNTNVITAIRVTDGNAADAPELPDLLLATDRRFKMVEVSADKGYLSHANLAEIEGFGAVPYIPFKTNSQGQGSAAWRRMWGLFMYEQPKFLAHYHRRSNVESTFSMIKRKFDGAVRSKHYAAQVNEVLCKALCHNLAVVVHAMHELGIEPTFPSERSR
jgi:transposase